jgi:hypothetical protein
VFGLDLKPKRGNRAGTKAMVKKISAVLESSSVDSDPNFLGFSASSKLGSVPTQSFSNMLPLQVSSSS